jgi:hypothetical protein
VINGKLEELSYPVITETEIGVEINAFELNDCLLIRTSDKNKFAYPTRKEALYDLLERNLQQNVILEKQIAENDVAIAIASREIEKLYGEQI